MDALLPHISVVIPLYNKSPYVQRAVESVLAQGDDVLEVIVVDDGSTDDGAARVEALNHEKVRLIRKPNAGVSSARNRGIEEARSEFIAFLDADDIYLPGFIDEIINLIRMFPQAIVYATSYARIWPDGKRQNAPLTRYINKTEPQIVEQLFFAFSRSTIFSISTSACVRRQAMIKHHIFFQEGENLGEDQDVIFRLAEKGAIAFSPSRRSSPSSPPTASGSGSSRTTSCAKSRWRAGRSSPSATPAGSFMVRRGERAM